MQFIIRRRYLPRVFPRAYAPRIILRRGLHNRAYMWAEVCKRCNNFRRDSRVPPPFLSRGGGGKKRNSSRQFQGARDVAERSLSGSRRMKATRKRIAQTQELGAAIVHILSRDACDRYDLLAYRRVCGARVCGKSRITVDAETYTRNSPYNAPILITYAHLFAARSEISRGAMQRDAAARSGVLMQIHTSCGAGSGHQGVPGVWMRALSAGGNVDRRWVTRWKNRT